jgi:hypothetical protein
MLQTIQGIYRNGKVELAEIPKDQSASLASQFMSFGMFSGSQQSTEADFRDAEFNGDIDDTLGWA